MNLKQKENLFKYLAKHFDSMDYPPILIWKNIKREFIKEGWRKRVKEILKGTVDYPGLYIHIPYCQTKCFFCKFKTRTSNSKRVLNEYLGCLKREIEEFSPLFKGVPFKTLYLAGGTPTIFSASQLDILFKILKKNFNLKETFQKLIEATPATLSLEKLKILKKHGINRITIGVQVLNKKLLNLINRKNQTKEMVRDVFSKAQKIGIEIINIDLVAGLPGQTTKSFLEDLDFILQMKPDALHLYSYEEESLVVFYRIGKRIKKEDRIRRNKMIELADKKIKKYGYRHYRNEPYLLSSQAANYQFQFRYFSNSSLLGLGAEALSYIPNHYAYENSKLEEYLGCRVKQTLPPYLNGYPITKMDTQLNYVLNNIRAGLNKKRFSQIYGLNFDKIFQKEISFLRKIKRLEENNGIIKLIAKNDFEFRTYSKFFFSQKMIKKLEKIVDNQ